MQIKNKIVVIIVCFIGLFTFSLNLYAEEFNISALEITVDKENEIVIGKGSVKAIDSEGKQIKADKITYKKQKEFLLAEGSVEVFDTGGNILKSDKATYDKIKEMIVTYENSEFVINEGYNLTSLNENPR
mgnify:CR=1 FL=1